MKRIKIVALCGITSLVMLSGCAVQSTEADNGTVTEMETESEASEGVLQNSEEDTEDSGADQTLDAESFRFVDAFGEEYETTLNPDVKRHSYNWDNLVIEGEKKSYFTGTNDDKGKPIESEKSDLDENNLVLASRLGIDVSSHQGEIDWQRVKGAGYDFVFIRIGYRGYGESGSLNEDTAFERNYAGARAAGLDVGVYFFSQAINEAEALEEADKTLEWLNGKELQLPVVFDPESIKGEEARTDNVTGAQFTANTTAYCEKMKSSGYDVAVYSNMIWEAFELDLTQLSDYPIWYADYEEKPQTPYDFTYWQYSEEGEVDGIDGVVDLDMEFLSM